MAEETFQSPMGWLKAEALKKIWLKLVTAETSHPLMSSLKVARSLKGFRHIRYLGNVPVADVPVGDGGVRFVGEPQVHRVLKVGVGQSGLGLFQVVEGQDFGRRKGPVVNADVVDGTMKIKSGGEVSVVPAPIRKGLLVMGKKPDGFDVTSAPLR